MMPIVDKYSEMGTVLIGKVESGGMKKGDILVVMPNRVSCGLLDISTGWYMNALSHPPDRSESGPDLV